MTSNSVTTFFAVVLIGAAVLMIAGVGTPRGRSMIAPAALMLATLVAVGATAGSLYLSEVAGFVPCELCWFQRIAMYPLAVLLPMALSRADISALRDARVLATAGLGISLYHIQLQQFPGQSTFCELTNPCTSSPVEALGWMTVPMMAAVSFALIIALATTALSTPTQEAP